MSETYVDADTIEAAARGLEALAGQVRAAGTLLEGSCLSVPEVGDVQAAAAFGQAHYDWAQTRFEDLEASSTGLATLAAALSGAARAYRSTEDDTAAALDVVLGAAGGRP